ncbi:aldolase catalytic domain-containing protein [Zunongwangia sp. F260]|uniref:Aldolase catalytic domain-containing protein n=1 Tax=Autumnicola lenta TaxID=3075593 RepID=A0ABU3CMY2_9FLAO|nr:aldolase catalytic domain-containing protein [Zunongwangia sp. F260]MDT0647592.1 aldolase catalytic domain-containing protein [Zunongwangia sp. F260]
MLNIDHKEKIAFLDCTLRDGGYYTNWDFDDGLLDDYLEKAGKLPIDFIEIGYRSKTITDYRGAFYYSPKFLLEYCKGKTDKKFAIILNEKEIQLQDLDELLNPCKGLISLVRLAVAPSNLSRVVELAENIKARGFLVSVNLMYASKWQDNLYLEKSLKRLNTILDYFYVVDSYGGMHPSEVAEVFRKLKGILDTSLGFHGHNNIEMALINSLTALNSGATIVDGTITGMGRGAGNLKTELFLTILHQKYGVKVNFDILNELSDLFLEVKKEYGWGTNLPYMVSGAYSLPQNEVRGQVKKRFYSLNAVISEVGEIGIVEKNQSIPFLNKKKDINEFLLIGGGKTPQKFFGVIREFLRKNPEIGIIHSSSKNIEVFADLANFQIHCIGGMEMNRLQHKLTLDQLKSRIFVVSRKKNSAFNFPEVYKNHIRRISEGNFQDRYELSATAMAVDIANFYKANMIMLIGYDGYDYGATKEELELFKENQCIFDAVETEGMQIFSVTSTKYEITTRSIFSLI